MKLWLKPSNLPLPFSKAVFSTTAEDETVTSYYPHFRKAAFSKTAKYKTITSYHPPSLKEAFSTTAEDKTITSHYPHLQHPRSTAS